MDNPKNLQIKFINNDISILQFDAPINIQLWDKGMIGCDVLVFLPSSLVVPMWKHTLSSISYPIDDRSDTIENSSDECQEEFDEHVIVYSDNYNDPYEECSCGSDVAIRCKTKMYHCIASGETCRLPDEAKLEVEHGWVYVNGPYLKCMCGSNVHYVETKRFCTDSGQPI